MYNQPKMSFKVGRDKKHKIEFEKIGLNHNISSPPKMSNFNTISYELSGLRKRENKNQTALMQELAVKNYEENTFLERRYFPGQIEKRTMPKLVEDKDSDSNDPYSGNVNKQFIERTMIGNNQMYFDAKNAIEERNRKIKQE